MKLATLADGNIAKIIDMSALPADTRKKLMVMGMLPETLIEVVRRAPMGDPLQIMVRGVAVAIRKQLAEKIEIEIT